MLDVDYEDVVADLEGQARRLIAFCGLDWEDRCLEFHRTQRPVYTASVTQVRRPIYHESVGRSRAYGCLLHPLLHELQIDDIDVRSGSFVEEVSQFTGQRDPRLVEAHGQRALPTGDAPADHR
jgi:hypothetical protein